MHIPVNIKLRAIERKRESSRRDALSKARLNTCKDGIYYRFYIL